ncbi:unnamed protein product [Trichogramma brassicae]|uniref:Reverse transcriptase RNase H-like domain-containing protein n=1 Tax=Trichogramma brassicae TaxID=86971 RepID=A0A6H5IWK3_9HYME|nr:unnamed protein product [Trichogramma brassicae]
MPGGGTISEWCVSGTELLLQVNGQQDRQMKDMRISSNTAVWWISASYATDRSRSWSNRHGMYGDSASRDGLGRRGFRSTMESRYIHGAEISGVQGTGHGTISPIERGKVNAMRHLWPSVLVSQYTVRLGRRPRTSVCDVETVCVGGTCTCETLADFDKEFAIQTDASDYAIGAVLTQREKNDGAQHQTRSNGVRLPPPLSGEQPEGLHRQSRPAMDERAGASSSERNASEEARASQEAVAELNEYVRLMELGVPARLRPEPEGRAVVEVSGELIPVFCEAFDARIGGRDGLGGGVRSARQLQLATAGVATTNGRRQKKSFPSASTGQRRWHAPAYSIAGRGTSPRNGGGEPLLEEETRAMLEQLVAARQTVQQVSYVAGLHGLVFQPFAVQQHALPQTEYPPPRRATTAPASPPGALPRAATTSSATSTATATTSARGSPRGGSTSSPVARSLARYRGTRPHRLASDGENFGGLEPVGFVPGLDPPRGACF